MDWIRNPGYGTGTVPGMNLQTALLYNCFSCFEANSRYGSKQKWLRKLGLFSVGRLSNRVVAESESGHRVREEEDWLCIVALVRLLYLVIYRRQNLSSPLSDIHTDSSCVKQ